MSQFFQYLQRVVFTCLSLSILLFQSMASVQADRHALSQDVDARVQLGVRPFFLLDDMDDGALKTRLTECAAERNVYKRTEFSIAHRGAPLQFPEHTEESYRAAALQGAGLIECDVTFTKDRALVCRHSQCDLHATTNILAIPELAASCTQPFTPANPDTGGLAAAKCCTSDITLEQFLSLKGKMDGFDKTATTIESYLDGTANFRTDLYSGDGTLMSHAQSIELFKSLGVKFIPELKAAEVEMPFDGDYTQSRYARALVDEYRAAGVNPNDVMLQSFSLDDIKFWIENEPAFAKQVVYLDDQVYKQRGYSASIDGMQSLYDAGIRILSPPMWALLTTDATGDIVPSDYAKYAKAAGLELVTWTLERSGPLVSGGGWYHKSVKSAINNDGDTLVVLDVLANKVGVRGVFSDWPATTSFYANCMGY